MMQEHSSLLFKACDMENDALNERLHLYLKSESFRAVGRKTFLRFGFVGITEVVFLILQS